MILQFDADNDFGVGSVFAAIAAIRNYALDPRNSGVTIVKF